MWKLMTVSSLLGGATWRVADRLEGSFAIHVALLCLSLLVPAFVAAARSTGARQQFAVWRQLRRARRAQAWCRRIAAGTPN